ncbi:MAG: hypothetical protein KBT18_12230, partial [Comamonas sp.]|nr:hypothetical protein [Candidatus Comamonas equi]
MSALRPRALLLGCLIGLTGCASQTPLPAAPPAPAPKGEIKGTATQHTAQSLQAALDHAWVSLPA